MPHPHTHTATHTHPHTHIAALESLAFDYDRQDELNITTVLGGVVFDELEGTSLTIRIRMNVTSVVDTTELKAT